MADDADFVIWQETTAFPGGYKPTIAIGPRVSDSTSGSAYEVTPELLAELTRYLTDILVRGTSEAALIKSFRKNDTPEEILGATIAELRENYPKLTCPIGMTVYQGVSLFTGEAFFTLQFDGRQERGQWSVDELRAFIGSVNELLSTAQWDNFVFKQLTQVVGIEENTVRAIISSVGDHK